PSLERGPIMQRVEQPDDHEHGQDDQRRHPLCTLRDPAPRRLEMRSTVDVSGVGAYRHDEQPHQHVGEEWIRFHCRRTLGSTSVYEISVIRSPTMYSTAPRNTIERTIEKSWAWIASMV